MKRDRRGERGNQTLEFTLIGIPLIFMLFSIANMSFSMLTLHTLQESAEAGARYASTRGSTCASPNTCGAMVENVAGVVATIAAGVNSSNMNVTMEICSAGVVACPQSTAAVNAVTCNPLSTCLAACTTSCNSNRTTAWPSSSNNTPGSYDVVITVNGTVTAPISLFWPSTKAGVASPGVATPGSSTYQAISRQRLMF